MRKRSFPVILFTLFLMFSAACQEAEQTLAVITTPTIPVEPTSGVIEDESGAELNDIEQEDDASRPEVVLWHPFSGVVAEQIELLAQQYNEEGNGSISIQVMSHADQEVLYADILNATEGEGKVPEIIIAPSNDIKNLYTLGEILELDSSDLSDLNIFPLFSNIDVMDDHRIGIPLYQSGNFIFYNQTWANDLGYEDYPKTIDEFNEQVCTAYRENRFDDETANDGTGGYFYPKGSIPFLAWMNAFGGGAAYNSRNEIILTGEENIQSLVFLVDLFADDCAWWTAKQDNPFRYFSERYTLAYSGEVEDIFAQQFVLDEDEIEDDWILIPYPSIDERPILFFDNYSFALMKNTPEASSEDMLDFISWMLKPENHAEIVYRSGVFPLSADEIREIDQDWSLYNVWNGTLQYIPYLRPFPRSSKWYITEKVLSDVGWQLIQYNVGESSVPDILSSAEVIVNTWQ